jgi:hypothetical protein
LGWTKHIVRRPIHEAEARTVGEVNCWSGVVTQDEYWGLEWRLVAPPAPPPVIGPRANLRSELAASHDLGADALAPHTSQGAIKREGGIHLIDPVNGPAGIERHVIAGSVAVEGDVQVVDAGAGHGDSLMIDSTA